MKRSWLAAGTSLLASAMLATSALAQTQVQPTAPTAAAPAQDAGGAAIATTTSWEHQGSDIPADPTWVTGVLPNGLRYAVRQDRIPANTISIRVRMGVGALMEDDDQQGWAHLLEHLVFRGTRDYPDGDAVKIWQRLGASFGKDTNAQTTLTATTFMLDLPRSDQASYAQALDVMAGMMRNATINPQLLATEKKVVLAERQARVTPLRRKVQDADQAIFLTGLKAAKRDVGGTDAALAAATAPELKAFYKSWYRPDDAVVVAVGDADPQMLVAGIRKAFGDWQGEGKAPAEPDYGALKPPPQPAAVVVDPQAPDLIQLGWMHPHDDAPMTIARQQAQFAQFVATAIIRQRLQTAAQGGQAIVNASAGYDATRHVADRFGVTLVPKPGQWQAALDQAFGVLNGLRDTPPSPPEIAQQVASMEEMLRKSVDARQTETAPALANTYIQDVDSGDVTAARPFYLKLFKAAEPSLTPEAVGQEINKLLAPDPRMVLLSSQPVAGGAAAAQAALASARKAAAASTEQLRKVSLDELKIPHASAKVVSRTTVPGLGIERVRFANGVELDYKQTPFEKDAIRLQVKIGHGLYGRQPGDPGLLWSSGALAAAGIGPFTPDELTRLTAGRQVGFGIEQQPDALSMSSRTDQEDIADAMKLMVGALTQMRYSETPLDRLKNQFQATYQAYFSSPGSVLQAFGAPYFHGGDNRFRAVPPPDAVASLTLPQFRSFWQQQLSQGPIRVVAAGDLDPDKLVAAVAKTFGALPTRTDDKPTAAELAVSADWTGDSPVILRHKGDPDQAAVAMVYPTTGILKDVPQSVALDIAASVIQDRLTEGFREKQGGTYTPFADSTQSVELPDYGFVLAGAQLSVERIGDFYTALDGIVADLAAHDPSADELKRAIATKQAAATRALTTNTYWLSRMAGDLDDPKYVDAVRSIQDDIGKVDAAAVQAAVKRWLATPRHAFKVEALPEKVAR
ncbi:MAG: M16 family metallopeptidase [Sphingomonas sp.]